MPLVRHLCNLEEFQALFWSYYLMMMLALSTAFLGMPRDSRMGLMNIFDNILGTEFEEELKSNNQRLQGCSCVSNPRKLAFQLLQVQC